MQAVLELAAQQSVPLLLARPPPGAPAADISGRAAAETDMPNRLTGSV